jgi:hypothetical protein
MTRWALFVTLGAASGCDLFQEVKDTFDGLTNPLVVQSVVMGIEADGLDAEALGQLDIELGVGASVFLADAANVSDLDQAPITGASARINSVDIPETGGGAYALEPGVLTYSTGAVWSLATTVGVDESGANFTLPPAPSATIPTLHTIGEPMTLSLSGQGFDLLIGLVADVSSGEITWSNEPQDIRDVYELSTGSATESLDIPGTAFPTSGAYVVGIAGLTKADADQMDNINTALSNVTAGKMILYPTLIP